VIRKSSYRSVGYDQGRRGPRGKSGEVEIKKKKQKRSVGGEGQQEDVKPVWRKYAFSDHKGGKRVWTEGEKSGGGGKEGNHIDGIARKHPDHGE